MSINTNNHYPDINDMLFHEILLKVEKYTIKRDSMRFNEPNYDRKHNEYSKRISNLLTQLEKTVGSIYE